jgi:hypothetical protein
MNITLNNMYKKFLKIGNIIEISYFYNDNLKKKNKYLNRFNN